jgi:hypothetical protein
MKKSVLHIKLMYRPIPGVSQSENRADSCRFDNGAEGFIIVDTWPLCKASKNLTSLVSVQGTISMKFVFENPFSSDHVCLGRARNKVPSVILNKSGMFFFHSATPMRISEGVTTRPRDW